jgi:spore germination cell wall hydrolase CwlJ-like protein
MNKGFLIVLLTTLIYTKELYPSYSAPNITYERDYTCLTKAIYAEARGESKRGKEAVAIAIKNRANDPRFSSTICGVISQKIDGVQQFPWASKPVKRPSNKLEHEAYLDSGRIAMETLNNSLTWDHPGVFFHSTTVKIDKSKSKWFKTKTKVIKEGRHVFYK